MPSNEWAIAYYDNNKLTYKNASWNVHGFLLNCCINAFNNTGAPNLTDRDAEVGPFSHQGTEPGVKHT